MEHSYFQDRLSAYHDNELPLQEKVVVEEHVRGCAECERLLEEYVQLDQLVADHGQLADSDYWEKAAQKIDRAIAGGGQTEIDHSLRNRRKSGLSWKLLAAAASVVIVGYLGINKDKFLTPDQQNAVVETPSAPPINGSSTYGKLQSDSVELQSQSTAEGKKDAAGAAEKRGRLKEEATRDSENRRSAPATVSYMKLAPKETTEVKEQDLRGSVSDKLAAPQTAPANAPVQETLLEPSPALSSLQVDSVEKVKLREFSNEVASLDVQAAPQDTGLGLTHWTAVRDSLLPMAEVEQKTKNVLELGKTVITGYDKAGRKPNQMAESAEPSPDARLAEACYWIAKLSPNAEEKAQAIATLRKIGDRSRSPLKDTVQNWVKELTAPHG